jgi:sorting nexin-29
LLELLLEQGKSTVDQTHTIKQIMEKIHEFNQDIYLLFVDFKQAYDSIKRSSLWQVMIELEILAKLMRLVKVCVQNSKCKVKFNSVMSEDFPVETGLRQGDALSPILFNIAMESMVKKVQEDSIGLKIGEQNVVMAAYADNIIIMGETEDQVRNTANKLI